MSIKFITILRNELILTNIQLTTLYYRTYTGPAAVYFVEQLAKKTRPF